MLTLKQIIRGNGNKFQDFFEDAAANLVLMSNIFLATIYEPNEETRKAQLAELAALEAANNVITHQLFNELSAKFITPFDREDIHNLISTLDDIADYMYATVRQLKYYNIPAAPLSTKNVATNLHIIIKHLQEAIIRLKDKRNLEQLYPICQEIKRTANLCTSLNDAGIARVYADEPVPLEAIKRLDHYEMVHTIIERCYNVTNVIEGVIIKYA
jgi:uncharacterized protein Yka (UPF0111/DUF47 family)